MKIRDIIIKNRSYRRFWNDHTIDEMTLRNLVDLARLTPSASNKQPLKYFLSFTNRTNDIVFDHIAWAGYLKDWHGPNAEEVHIDQLWV